MDVDATSEARYAERDPDVRLMLRVRDDDAAAFEEIVTRYQNRLISVLRNLVGNQDQAEDLAQEVFLRVFRARRKYTPTAKFSTWLFTIATNVASNARRAQARRHEVNLAPANGHTSTHLGLADLAKEASALMPTRQLDALEREEMVTAAMQSLNDRQRMAVLLSKFEGMSYADIAETMDLTPQAVKSLLSRARGVLRDILEPYIEPT